MVLKGSITEVFRLYRDRYIAGCFDRSKRSIRVERGSSSEQGYSEERRRMSSFMKVKLEKVICRETASRCRSVHGVA